MTVLGQLRRSQHLIRSVFAVFMLAWLQMVMAPCAMARDSMDQAQAMNATDMSDCIYCPPQHAGLDQQGSDGDAATGCVYLHASQADNSNAQQLQLAQLVFHAVPIDSSALRIDATPVSAAPRHVSVLPLSRPLSLTYCVQLK